MRITITTARKVEATHVELNAGCTWQECQIRSRARENLIYGVMSRGPLGDFSQGAH